MNFITILICLFLIAGTFLFWKFVTWFLPKFVMHGFLWSWHKSHRTKHDHTLETFGFLIAPRKYGIANFVIKETRQETQ